ncbi:MAG: tRNA (adenosine(37)-N6)-threonylcarbamoyltransferase complex transferase subunit TsaD [Rhodomicrobium sp.]|nr:tRNA (adenosine(37)-N6)-threonylcarbamoyltransferase complex transferase subunit TsaD [Rhodomicrobium sp.]
MHAQPAKNGALTVLGIETSCDETAAAVVRRDVHGRGTILSNIVRSQFNDHAPYGGVVPEIAARAHAEILDSLIKASLEEAHLNFRDLDGIAATAGPGLIGGLLAGLVTAKAIALVQNLPLVAVNHLEGHALTVGLTEALDPPYLLLLVSGGHSKFLRVGRLFDYQKLGGTIDDALGEAFDKVAKMLGLGFPGGPAVEEYAAGGDPRRFAFPRPLLGRDAPDFSFSGLKTAVRQAALTQAPLSLQDIRDLCASFQAAAADTVRDRLRAAFRLYNPSGFPKSLVVAGGVAANKVLRAALLQECEAAGYSFHAPPPSFCTDNAAMIAWAGASRLDAGYIDPLDVQARARWPIAETCPAGGLPPMKELSTAF